MTAQEYALLSADEKKGIINVTDESGDPVTASDIGFDNSDTSFTGTDVQEVLEEVDTKLNIKTGSLVVGEYFDTYISQVYYNEIKEANGIVVINVGAVLMTNNATSGWLNIFELPNGFTPYSGLNGLVNNTISTLGHLQRFRIYGNAIQINAGISQSASEIVAFNLIY